MKTIIATLLLLTTFSAHSTGVKKALRFEKRKAMALEGIAQKITYLQELKSCVSSANNKDALKVCRKAHQEKRKALKEARKNMRMQKE